MPTSSASSVSIVGPGQQHFAAIECRDVTPRVSDDWFSHLLEKLLPYAAAPVRRFAIQLYGTRVTEDRQYPLSFPFEHLVRLQS